MPGLLRGIARTAGIMGAKRTSDLIPLCHPLPITHITVEIVPDEAIELIHDESAKILEEVGCEFRDPEAAQMWKSAGADVQGFLQGLDLGVEFGRGGVSAGVGRRGLGFGQGAGHRRGLT